MKIKGKKIGVAFTGSFCTYEKAFLALEKLVEEGAMVQPIFSEAAQSVDSRFGKGEEFVKRAEEITGHKIMGTIAEAEPIGPKAFWICSSFFPVRGIPLQSWQTGLQILRRLWRQRLI